MHCAKFSHFFFPRLEGQGVMLYRDGHQFVGQFKVINSFLKKKVDGKNTINDNMYKLECDEDKQSRC